MLPNLGTIFKDHDGLWRYLWEVSSGEGGIFGGRRYLRGKIKKSKIKKCGRDIAWDVFRWDFYHKKKNSGLMAFRNLQNFRLRRQKMKKTVTK